MRHTSFGQEMHGPISSPDMPGTPTLMAVRLKPKPRAVSKDWSCNSQANYFPFS